FLFAVAQSLLTVLLGFSSSALLRAVLCRVSESCHPDRSGPTFSSAPPFGASGRAARFVRPVRFAGVEGSWHPPTAASTFTLLLFHSFTLKPNHPIGILASAFSERSANLPCTNRAYAAAAIIAALS